MSRRAQSSSGYKPVSSSGKRSGAHGEVMASSTGGPLQGPYGVQKDNRRAQTSHRLVDKQSILWRDFQNGIKRRKRSLNKLREVAADSASSSGLLKQLLLEIRQITLRVIEDSLEIEYKASMTQGASSSGGGGAGLDAGSSMSYNGSLGMSNKGRTAFQNPLPPITSFKGMERQEDVLDLAAIIDDVDDLFRLPNIQVFLPVEFPGKRNPFLLGKSVDELAVMVAPQAEPGNLDDELKVLELMRYKRASKALLKAEAQIVNRLPLQLAELEMLWRRMNDDAHTERLVRCVVCLLDNDTAQVGQNPDVSALVSSNVTLEPYEFLNRLNAFQGQETMRVDVQVPVRKALRDCALEYMEDEGSVYLIEWVNSVLAGTMLPGTGSHANLGEGGGGSVTGGGSSVFSGQEDYRLGNVGRNSQVTAQSIRSIDGGGMYNMSPSRQGGMNMNMQQFPGHGPPVGGDLVSLATSNMSPPAHKKCVSVSVSICVYPTRIHSY